MFEKFMELMERQVEALESIVKLLSSGSKPTVETAAEPEAAVVELESNEPETSKVFGEGNEEQKEELDRKQVKAELDQRLGKGNYNTRCSLKTLSHALELVREGRHCIACGGTGNASKGGVCAACEGTGEAKVLPDAEPEADVLDAEPEKAKARPAPNFSEDDVRLVLAKLLKSDKLKGSKDDKKRVIKDIVVTEGGADKLADVDAEKYGAIIDAAEELLNGVKEEDDLDI